VEIDLFPENVDIVSLRSCCCMEKEKMAYYYFHRLGDSVVLCGPYPTWGMAAASRDTRFYGECGMIFTAPESYGAEYGAEVSRYD